MTKTNVWELVSKEAESIIKAIEKGEINTRKEYYDYLETIYSWSIVNAIESIVKVYMSINKIEMPWNNEKAK